MKEGSATIVIATKNRRSDLASAIDSCISQSTPIEIIVVDDGSTDGTSEMVKTEYPNVKLFTFEDSKGYIVRRNFGSMKAANEVIVSIDDDAVLSTSEVVKGVLKEFSDPRIAAVAIPFINVNQNSITNQHAPDLDQIWVTNEYIGTAHAIRRSVFLENDGYCDEFVHQGEEGDLCIRLLDRGFYVKLGSGDPIHHFESPNRSGVRMNFYGQRNLILFAWRNVPVPFLLIHLPVTIINGLIWGWRNEVLLTRVRGTIAGLAFVLFAPGFRNAVRWKTYLLYREMKKKGPIALNQEVELL